MYQKTLPNATFAKRPHVHLRMPKNLVLVVGAGGGKLIVPRKLESSGGAVGDAWEYIACVECVCVNLVAARSPYHLSSSIDLYLFCCCC